MWAALIKGSSFTSPFQTPEYYDCLAGITGMDSFVLAAADISKYSALAVVTVFKQPGLTGYFSRRGIIFGGPVISEISNEDLSVFLIEISKRLLGNAIYLETRNLFSYINYHDAFINSGWEYVNYLNIRLRLKDLSIDDLQKLFTYNRRREIRLSIENGAVAREISSLTQILEVYKILEKLYRTRVKLPLPPSDFFVNCCNSGLMKIFCVEHNNKIIGGSFCPFLPGRAVYTFYYCGERDYHKQIFPTHLAILAALNFAAENKIPAVDFMGAGLKDSDYGVRKYKLEFGGELVEEGRYLKILSPLFYNIGKNGLKLIRKVH